jgi:RNA polymerase sigma-70 factor (ECF subfamily)
LDGPRKELLNEHHRLFLPLLPRVRLPGLSAHRLSLLLTQKAGRLAASRTLIVSTSSSLQNLFDQRASFLAFVKRRVRDPELAEDILQTAYVRALEKSSGLRDDGSVVAWFYAVLRNAVIDHFRRRASESSAYDRWAQDLASNNLVEADPSTRSFVCGCIEHVLALLRPAYAELLREVDLKEVPLTEFAERYQLTPGNAAVRAHRARSALRKQLALTCGACSVHSCVDCVCKHPRQRQNHSAR